KGRDLIEQSGIEPTTKWHPSVMAFDLLMSRVALYQEKWSEAIEYADRVIANGTLTKLSTPHYSIINENNDDIIYSFLQRDDNIDDVMAVAASISETWFQVSPKLLNLYHTNDIRKDLYFVTRYNGGRIMVASYKRFFQSNIKEGVKARYTALGWQNFRVAEAWLNKAEAMAQQGNASAIELIKTLHSYRFNDASGVEYPTDIDAVLDYVLDERLRELCFEEHHRWFDLRRMKNRPEIEHVYSTYDSEMRPVSTQRYILSPDDTNYTLPIPLVERDNNHLIKNYERYDKLPAIDE
ncbi:MAG: RagB/SusD family nutrient uptake outer membrane protein, partial [Bacteroidales bacterium]|nr:RagB/SusD family nutrient uptake outer membrane protein [Bacteroidales bacterium]